LNICDGLLSSGWISTSQQHRAKEPRGGQMKRWRLKNKSKIMQIAKC
jgi:hypothetical protein